MREKNPTICIIGDGAEGREMLRRYLLHDIDYHYRFYEAENGERGLKLCQQVQPDCILLECDLHDMDALAFLERLKDETGSQQFTIIMLAGQDDEDVALQAMKSGAQDYLVKNEMTPGNLFRAIHNAIERSALLRILEKQRVDLEKKNQEIQAFAYALAHDLRAPLRAISGFTQIVVDEHSSGMDAEGQRYMGKIAQACGQMDHLIDELLSYTRIEHRVVRSRSVALVPLFQDILAQYPAERSARIQIALNMPAVYGDSLLIKHIFVNLLDNALTYQRSGVNTKIQVNWINDGAYVVISVADNGIGIAPEHYDKIFHIFQRLHGYEEYAGNGIGLAIVRKAAELMGGCVWVESRENVGSTFFVKLPDIAT